MSSSPKVILDLIKEDYALYVQKREYKHPSEKYKQELFEQFDEFKLDKEGTELIIRGYIISSLEEICSKLKEHQTKLSEAGIGKNKIKHPSTNVTLSYKFKSTLELHQFFKAPWKQRSTEPNSCLQAISVFEDDEKIEFSCNLKV